MKKLFNIVLLCLFIAIQSFAQTKEIVILSTNDMHATIDNYAKIASYVKSQRAKNPNLLVLSGGDLFSGNPLVDQYPDKGYPIVDLMNRVGYQYTAIGNHEFDYDQTNLAKRMKQAKFKFICANMHVDKNIAKFPQPEPYATFKIGDTKVCILSLIEVTKRRTGELLPATHPSKLKGVTFTYPIEKAVEYKNLRNQCDLFIALTHNGYDVDKKLAKAMPELDVIIGGHSHTKIDSSEYYNGVLVNQAGDKIKYIGKTTITLDGNKVVRKRFELINVSTLKDEDAKIKSIIEKYHKNSPLKRVIATTDKTIGGKEQLGSMMTDAITSEYGVDIVFQNSGGIRIGELNKGNITLSDIYRLDPFGNTVVIYSMTPSQIREMLSHTYQSRSRKADLMVSGISYKLYSHDGKLTRVELKDMKGNNLDENKSYKVAMNSYISSSYPFDHTGLIQETSDSASDALIKYLEKIKKYTPVTKRRTEVVEE